MKLKVKWYDKKLLIEYFSKIGLIISIIEFFKSIDYLKMDIFKCFFEKILTFNILIAIVLYVYLFLKTNTQKKLYLKINKIEVEIRIGNIFNEKGLKVIPFNEYFDTQVDEKIISSKSLNGQFLIRRDLVTDINQLDELLKKEMISCKIRKTRNNNKKRNNNPYYLGSIFKYRNEYLLTAFSKFSNNNEAYLELRNYYLFLENFWKEISKNYAGNNIIIPLLGSGITRLDVDDEELLKMILLTLKMSRIKLNKLVIVLTEEKIEKIDLYHLKELIN